MGLLLRADLAQAGCSAPQPLPVAWVLASFGWSRFPCPVGKELILRNPQRAVSPLLLRPGQGVGTQAFRQSPRPLAGQWHLPLYLEWELMLAGGLVGTVGRSLCGGWSWATTPSRPGAPPCPLRWYCTAETSDQRLFFFLAEASFFFKHHLSVLPWKLCFGCGWSPQGAGAMGLGNVAPGLPEEGLSPGNTWWVGGSIVLLFLSAL